MLTVRIGVIAAAFLVLPSALLSTWAQARDCERYPALCEPPVQATAATDPAPRAAPVQKRKARVAKRPAKSRMATKSRMAVTSSRAVAREQPDVRASPEPRPEPAPRLAAAATTVLDAAVMLPQSLADAATALATDAKRDGEAPAADVPSTSPPTDDAHGGAAIELAPAEDADVADALASVRFVDAGQVNEIDLAAAAPEPARAPWLRYLLAMTVAVLAAASAVRFFFA
jgi:hypothetical protein